MLILQRIAGLCAAAGFVLAGAHVGIAQHGKLDRSFGGGWVMTPGASDVHAVVAMSNGDVLVGGAIFHGDGPSRRHDFGLVRYRGDGRLDTRFGSAGVVVTPILDQSWLTALLVQRSGSIIAVGVAAQGSTQELALARYLSDGSLDRSFAHGGVVTTPVLDGAGGLAAALQRDGKIVVAGATEEPTGNHTDELFLARYLPSGRLDLHFGSGGIVTNADADAAAGVAIQRDGRIVVAAASGAAFRYTPAGAPDRTFGTNGESAVPLVATPEGLALQPTGAVVIVGQRETTPREMYAVRYTPRGVLDPTFGSNGVVLVPPLAGAAPQRTPTDWASAVVTEPAGKLAVAGYNGDGNNSLCGNFEIVLLRSDGSLDPAFGHSGRWLIPLNHCVSGAPDALTKDAQGRLLVTGLAQGSTQSWFATIRVLSGN
jgi:uncharacterized delta-60 repeat protein